MYRRGKEKCPSLARLKKGEAMKRGVSALGSNDWVNVITTTERKAEILNVFQYNMPFDGIDLTYYYHTNKLRVSVRYSKLSGDDKFLGSVFELGRSPPDSSELGLRIGDAFELLGEPMEVFRILEDGGGVECSGGGGRKVLQATRVVDLVRAYLK